MKFTLENAPGIQIHACRPGEVVLRVATEGPAPQSRLVTYTTSLILGRQQSIQDWAVRHADEIQPHHFQAAWQERPEIVLFGSGRQLVFPENAIRFRFMQEKIGFESMDTAAACRTYNILTAEGRDVMALLIID